MITFTLSSQIIFNPMNYTGSYVHSYYLIKISSYYKLGRFKKNIIHSSIVNILLIDTFYVYSIYFPLLVKYYIIYSLKHSCKNTILINNASKIAPQRNSTSLSPPPSPPPHTSPFEDESLQRVWKTGKNSSNTIPI